jgi:hypothetical protein
VLGILAIHFVLIVLPFVTDLLVGTDISNITGITLTVIGFLLYLPVLLVTCSIMRTFITGSWTLTYRG